MTMLPTGSLILGSAFVAVAAISVWLILESMSRGGNAQRSRRLVAAHRIGGYLFIAIFCVMIWIMAARLRGDSQTSGSISIHFTLALILAPLIFIKVLLARRYRNQASALMPLGILIFVLACVVVGIPGFPYLSRQTKVEQVSLDRIGQPPVTLDVTAAAALMQQKCSKCHTLERVVGAQKDAGGWATTIARMEARPDSGITDSDARTIAAYLASRSTPQNGSTPMTVARALIDERCSRCHTLERVYSGSHTRAEWQAIVSRMEAHASGSSGMFRPGETQQIVDYLAQMQSPDSKNAAMPPVMPAPVLAPPAAASSTDFRPLGLGLIVFGVLAYLAVKRPGTARPPGPAPAAPPKVPAKTPPRVPMVLKLIDITQQTSDSKTLRFALPPGIAITVRPGQFLSFTFLFDGRKETRCYSICSSPARTGYIEITPKRAPNGCVSVYLNESAAAGLTVEASGPHGEFCLDPERHRRVVLIAAGSGMTPMMAMLRYIDDLRLDIDATLLYCVRNPGDIFFQAEIEDMRKRMKSFRYIAQLSDPPSGWNGWKGRISAEFVSAAVSDFTGQEVFICGPAPFMEAARAIVVQLGASPDHVQQERFAGPSIKPAAIKPPDLAPDAAAPTVTIEFTKSGKTVTMQQSQAILQVAEDNGVNIPFSCRQGQCGTCKTRLLDGSVVMDSENGLDDDSRARGFVLTCVGHPSGDVRLDA